MQLNEGSEFKGYKIREYLNKGGFGAVYSANQISIKRDVAIKVISPEHSNEPDFIRRFEAEAQMIGRLEHPYIVPLYDYWRDPNGAYLVMRLLKGGSLKDLIKQQKSVSIEDTASILHHVCQALNTSHRNQVIHRDIKPGNILLDEEGNAYLADFGIAKDYTSVDLTNDPESIRGTLDYISPEQARGEAVTPATDIYCLGVVLYEMLTGEHPFPNSSGYERLFNHLNDNLPEIVLDDMNQSVDINDVIQTATAKNPAKRYQEVMAFFEAFKEAAGLDNTPPSFTMAELLTPRELEVLKLMSKGKSRHQIAEHLVVELSTVKTHINKIYRKLNVNNRRQAIARANTLDLFSSDLESQMSFGSNLPEPENPYKGLQAFQIADNNIFFGREKLINKLLARIQEDVEYRRFMAVVGPSGSGKSSLVKAGLIPDIWRGAVSGSENWYIIDMIPGKRPLDELEVALNRIATDDKVNLHEQLLRDTSGLLRLTDMLLPEENSELLLVIDQFEEVFTLVEDEKKRQHFLKLIYEAVTDPHSRVRVIVTLRADYYDKPLQYPDFGKLIRNRIETILPLSAEELERAIREPANKAGVRFEDGLVSRIVSDVHYQPGALPLLQYALTELFEYRNERLLTQEAYQRIGGTGGALANRADEIFNDYDEESQQLIRQMFMRLVTLGEGAEDARRRTDRAELLAITEDHDTMDDVINAYAESRLLSLDHDPGTRQPTVEVAHEAILREWDRLRQWLNDSREDIRQERILARATHDWNHHDRDSSYLLSGARLEEIESWQTTTELALTPLEQAFIQASVDAAQAQEKAESERQAREREQEERTQALTRRALRLFQGLVAMLAIGLLIAGVLVVVANSERVRAEDNEFEARRQASIGLGAIARNEVDNANAERGILVALEGLENYPFTPQAKAALIYALDGFRPVRIFEGLESIGHSIPSAQWSPNGDRIAAVGEVAGGGGNAVIIWDAVTGSEILSVNKYEDICSYDAWHLSWSPGGEEIAQVPHGTDGCGIAVWNTSSGETRLILSDYSSFATRVSWSSDGTTIATAHQNGDVILWNVTDGEIVAVLGGQNITVHDVAWSPDSKLIATASEDSRVRIWNAQDQTVLSVLEGHVGPVYALAWSPDSTRLVSGGYDGLSLIWDVAKGEPILVLRGHDNSVRALDWSSNGDRIASLEHGRVNVWHAETGTLLYQIDNPDQPFVKFSPTGDELITAQSAKYGQVFVWDVSSTTTKYVGHKDDVIFANWSPDGQLVVSVGNDNTRLWNANTGQEIASLPLHQTSNAHGDWSPDGTQFVTAFQPPSEEWSDEISQAIVIWDIESKEVVQLPISGAPVAARWSPEGSYIVNSVFNPSGLNAVYLWDAETHELLWTYEPDDLNCFPPFPEFSPDSSKIVGGCFAFDNTGRNTFAFIVDVETGDLLKTIEGNHGSIFHAVWSPDGGKILVGYQDQGIAEIRDANTGDVLQSFAGHGDGKIKGAEWHPDGVYVVTGDGSGVVKVWNSQTGEEVAGYFVGAEVQSTHWSPDGTQIIIGGRINEPVVQRVWLSTDDLIAHAYDCCVTRELTLEERQQFGLPTE